RSGSTQSRGGIDNSGERCRKLPRVVHQKNIRRNIDIAPWAAEGIGEDLTIVQNQGLRVDVDVAATTLAHSYRGRDLGVRQLDHTRCIHGDVTSIRRNCPRGDAAASHLDLIARGNVDVTGETTAR